MLTTWHIADTTIWPAVWSATAATLSAVAAWSVWRIQRRNHIDSVRPDLVLTGWAIKSRRTPNLWMITAEKVRNIGRGAGITINVENPFSHRPWMLSPGIEHNHLTGNNVAVLAPGEEAQLDASLAQWPTRYSTDIRTYVRIVAFDIHENRYVTTYEVAYCARIDDDGDAELELDHFQRHVHFTPRWRVKWHDFYEERLAYPLHRLRAWLNSERDRIMRR